MPHQIALTVKADVLPGRADALRQLLNAIGEECRRAELLPFEELPVHFARFFLLDEAHDLKGAVIPAALVFLSDVDAPLHQYLSRLAARAGPGLDQIFSHCEGYPQGPDVIPQERVRYLQARMVRSATVYVNTVGRSLEQVRAEARLREAVEDFLDRPPVPAPGTPAGVWDHVQRQVAADPTLTWATQPASRPGAAWRLRQGAHLLAAPLAVLVALPLILPLLPFWLILLRIREKRDPARRLVPDPAHVEQLAAREDKVVQNQFAAVGFLKPGPFRRLTLSVVLWVVNYTTRHVFNHGSLAGVRTIHFARWTFIDEKRRLIFASNYDGSLESYMDDFIDKVAWGLNAVFSNGVDFPRTNWLVRDGARDELAFKNLLRVRQVDTPIWYSAYGDLTAMNVANNAAIRAGLSGAMSADQAAVWAGRI